MNKIKRIRYRSLSDFVKESPQTPTAILKDGRLFEVWANGLIGEPKTIDVEGKPREFREKLSLTQGMQQIKTMKVGRVLVAERVNDVLCFTSKALRGKHLRS
ncbi:hypothetical protein [Fructobacillus evanidus]|uniref:Uncharacterized protein n=1 Tax=Fructobacillus evanidus TaxID=3064281 RepID=A0ABN9YYU9_9LACO|nr:unnamed protein product [Fructobacillus sp. LMG 32999]CAK1229263.1 unnamed protein product [Fructobacillus sp. LMG 32999]CAK1231355.1 unnamed protein product [Fructobacillus sp. LMG 32999]CAK1231469.1 unnamed protein product [Fructobacillus sp. LMG 32999]CAK1232572.1 unnamed protein product [Fructobacillus sp. LMG 32999]